jgi:hypothetical protein
MTLPPSWLSLWLRATTPHLRQMATETRREGEAMIAQADAMDEELRKRAARGEKAT